MPGTRRVAKGPRLGSESATSGIRTGRAGYGRPVARPPRIATPGGIYHITARGNRRQAIFTTDDDHLRFLLLLATVIHKRRWRLWAYCLMPNHYHLVVTTPRGDLSEGMHWLNSTYAHWFNEIHEVDGHVFQRRFHAVSVEHDGHLLELARYLVLNPVRARLCTFPGEWRWSSYRAMRGMPQAWAAFDPRPMLSLFGRRLPDAHLAFGAFVDDGRTGSRPT